MKPPPTTDILEKPFDWSRADAMTDEEIEAAALADPDARPMTDEEWARATKVPRIAIIRRALKLSEEEFSARYRIPIEMLRDWEAGRTEPDEAMRAYLRVIAKVPEVVREALG